MLIELEKRREPSSSMVYLTPVLAVLLTMVVGAVIFSILGFNGVAAVWEIFIQPLVDPGAWQDLGVKAAPLIMIAVGLSIGFRANVWRFCTIFLQRSAWRSRPGISKAAGGCCR